MCVQTARRLIEGAVHPFQINLRGLLEDVVSVTAEVKWVHPLPSSFCRVGAQFIASDKAYFGPQEEDLA
jgi:hypothetical protein